MKGCSINLIPYSAAIAALWFAIAVMFSFPLLLLYTQFWYNEFLKFIAKLSPNSSLAWLRWSLMLTWPNPPTHPPTQPPTQPGKYQASKIKQFMLNGSCQSLGIKLKTVFGPNLNNLNSSLKAIIDSKDGKLKIQWISIQHSMHKQFVALYDYSQHNFRPFKNIESKMLFS